jgi:hypothetical protein
MAIGKKQLSKYTARELPVRLTLWIRAFVLLYSNTKSGVVPPHSKAASAAVGNNWPRI